MKFARQVYLCMTSGTKWMPAIFFIEALNCNYIEMYTYHGHKRFKIYIIFPQNFLHFQHALSAFAWDFLRVCRSRKISDEVSVCILRGGGGGGNRINVGWCWIKIIGRMTSWLIFLFDRILRICRFGSFNVCTYHTVSIVAALFRHVCLRSTAQWNWRQNFSDFEPVTFLSFLRKHKGITFYRIFSNMSFLSSVIYSYIFTNSCTISQFLIFILLHNSAHIPFTTAMFYFHYSKSAIFRINAHRKHLLLLLAACVCPWI